MKRGEVWRVALDPTLGAEIRKTRPAVIISNDAAGALPLRIAAPVTRWKPEFRDVPWMVQIADVSNAGLSKPSVIDTFQLRSLSTERFLKRLGILDPDTAHRLDHALLLTLDLLPQRTTT